MDKTLNEIEKEYTTEIVKFFCKSYARSTEIVTDGRREDITNLLSNQIKSRLSDKGIIKDYKVEVILYPTGERRDVVIDNILEDKDVDVVNKIFVHIQHKDRTFLTFEHLL